MQMKVFLGWLSSTFVFQTFIPCHMTGSGLVFAESSNLTSVWAAHVSTGILLSQVSMPANSELKVNNSRTRSKHFVNLPIVEVCLPFVSYAYKILYLLLVVLKEATM
ncbi:hypothetical protein SCA6_004679 [Theobroma cacao]